MADLAPGSNKATIKADHRAYAAESLSVERTGLCFQVSALAFINERILLAGVGPLLRVFDIHTNTLITEILVLDHSRIHGIRVHSSIVESIGSAVDKDECTILNPRVYKVAVFGGKHLRTLEITQTIRVDTGSPDISIRLLDPFPKFSDWILEAHWVKANKSSTEYSALVLVFSHNYVQAWSLETRMLLKHIQSEERCLLYAARCFGMCLEDVQVASARLDGHDVKHVWGLAVDPSHSVIATGGGDGGIRLWGMKDVAESQTGDHGMVSVSLLKDCEPAKRAEFPRAFSFSFWKVSAIGMETHKLWKIVDIFLLDRGAHSDCSSDSDIIVLTHEGEYAVWYKLSGLDGMQGSPVYSVHANLIIPGKNSVTAVSLQIAHQVVVIGTRSGSVIAYDALGDNGSQRNLEPVLVSHSAHGDEA
ncbi:hypothetical protein BASA81_017267 [Batrachochytrium salamandrivorans]|nr:hypothetical protein BASA81_017267 [Batrachochytrium salamandrivorans]